MSRAAKTELKGVIVPVITPLDKHENLSQAALKKQLDFLIDSEVDAIFLGGSAGMGPMLDEQVWKDLMLNAKAIIGNKIKLMAGVIETSTRRAVGKIKFLESIGYTTIVLTPTFYIALERPMEFMRHFGVCREASDMQIIAYNIPQCTNSTIPAECLEEMGKKNWLTGLKESSGDRNYFKKALTISRQNNLGIFQGSETDISWSLTEGADGIVPVCANFAPRLYVEAWINRNDKERLEDIQLKIDQNKINYVTGDGERNWLWGVVGKTKKNLNMDCVISAPLS